MTHTVVELSNGEEIEVRQLGIFEIDRFDPDPLGPFTFTGKTLAGEVQIEYDGSRWEEPPPKPEVDDPEEGSDDWWALREWELYHAWIRHETRRMEAAARYHEKVAKYILETCVNGGKEFISTPEDWQSVHSAALVPQLSQEDVAEALRNTFQGYV